MDSLGARLGQLRRERAVVERRDVLQAEIAEAVGVTVTAYSRWETDKRVPREAELLALAAYFGVTPAYLRYGVQDAPPQAFAPVSASARKRGSGA